MANKNRVRKIREAVERRKQKLARVEAEAVLFELPFTEDEGRDWSEVKYFETAVKLTHEEAY